MATYIPATKVFSECVSPQLIDVYVEASPRLGISIYIESDPYEGSVSMTLSEARSVHAALGRAIEAAKKTKV